LVVATAHEKDRILGVRLVSMVSLGCDGIEQLQFLLGGKARPALWTVPGSGYGDQGSNVWNAAFAALAPAGLAVVVAE